MRDRWQERRTPPCPRCGRRMSTRQDGQLRRHRTFDSPAAPWCQESP